MRRENYEVGVSRPEVIQKEINGEIHEPFEQIVIDIEEQHQGSIMEEMGLRKADLQNMEPDGKGRMKLDFIAPSRGMIGFRSNFLTLTSGTGIMTLSVVMLFLSKVPDCCSNLSTRVVLP